MDCLKLYKKNKKLCDEIRNWFGSEKELCPKYKAREKKEEKKEKGGFFDDLINFFKDLFK